MSLLLKDVPNLFLGGFYSQKVTSNPNLRIISLNTNLYYGPNVMTLNKTDPANQFKWLENTLNTSQQNNEKVSPTPSWEGTSRRLNLFIELTQNQELIKVLKCQDLKKSEQGHFP